MQDMKRIRKYRHGKERKGLGLGLGLGLHVISCYKSYWVERLAFISLILNKDLKLCFFSCNPKEIMDQ